MYKLPQLAELVSIELDSTSSTLEVFDDIIWINRGQDRVALAEARLIFENQERGLELLRAVRDGTAMLVLFGDVTSEQRRTLLDVGVFDVHTNSHDHITIATSVSNALDLQRLRTRVGQSAAEIRRYRFELREIIETARVISSERNTRDLFETILGKCRDITNADAGTIYLVEGKGPLENRSLTFKYTQNDTISPDYEEFSMPVSRSSMAGAAALERKIINVSDVRVMPPELRFKHDISVDKRTGYRTVSVLSAPMISQKDEVVGVVQLINRKRSAEALLLDKNDFEDHVVPFDARSVELVRILASHAAVAFENALLYEQIQQIFEDFVMAAVHAIEQRDPPTSGHSERVAMLTEELARGVHNTTEGPFSDTIFTEQEMLELRYASLLHDFGKIGVPEAVLTKQKKLPESVLDVIKQRFESARLGTFLKRQQKLESLVDADSRKKIEAEYKEEFELLQRMLEIILRANEPTILDSSAANELVSISQKTFTDSEGKSQHLLTSFELDCLSIRRGSLTAEEFDQIRSHALKTDQFLSRINWGSAFPDLPRISSSHHERPDGTGYPNSWVDKNIPLKAKIMAVADVFDALTAADRPYKKAVPLDRALEIIQLEADANHLDPELVRLFIAQRVYECVLGEGREAS